MELRALQQPLKDRYREDPSASRITLVARGNQSDAPIACSVDLGRTIYDAQAHPGVGAILHVHAWMQDIPATDVNYPCGTEELAISVAELLAAEPNPNEAVIGLRNHGITVTGPSLLRILDRIEPTILRQIPML
jgi:hypothetical protein